MEHNLRIDPIKEFRPEELFNFIKNFLQRTWTLYNYAGKALEAFSLPISGASFL